jgi:putative ABC transport system substrate-binding protein
MLSKLSNSVLRGHRAAATSLAVQTSAAPVHVKDEIEGVIAAQARDPGGGLIVRPSAFNVVNRELISALAARHGVPAIAAFRSFADSGGLMAYAFDFTEVFRQAAGYIDRILNGEKPADMPVAQHAHIQLTSHEIAQLKLNIVARCCCCQKKFQPKNRACYRVEIPGIKK